MSATPRTDPQVVNHMSTDGVLQTDKSGLLASLGHQMAGRRKTVMLVWLLVALAAAPLAITLNGALSRADWDAQGSTAQKVRTELRRDFAQLGAEAAIVVYHQHINLSKTNHSCP